MSINHKFYPAASTVLGDRQIRARASTSSPDRAGDIMVPSGAQLAGFRKNPLCLWQHDPMQPVGTADVSVVADGIDALITFAAKGVSSIADTVCGLYKSGVLSAVSIGFSPQESEPLKGGGLRFTKWSLYEISCVSIPCNEDALVVQRSGRPRFKYQTWTPPAVQLSSRQQAARATSPAEFAFYKRLEFEQDARARFDAIDSQFLANMARPETTRAERLARVEALRR